MTKLFFEFDSILCFLHEDSFDVLQDFCRSMKEGYCTYILDFVNDKVPGKVKLKSNAGNCRSRDKLIECATPCVNDVKVVVL